MTCRECAEGRRFSDGGIYCVQYGMIIRESHECTLPGAKEKPPAVATPTDLPEAEERKNYA